MFVLGFRKFVIFVILYNFSIFFSGVVITVWCGVEEDCYDVTRASSGRSDWRKNEKMRQLLRVGLSFSAVVADGDRVQHAPVSEPVR